MRTFLFSFLLFAATLPAQAAGGPREIPEGAIQEFQQFWDRFRPAAVAGRCEDVVAMTRFPFKTRGQVDSDPVLQHDREKFLRLCPSLLESDPGVPRTPQTMKAFMERRPTVTAKDFAGSAEKVWIGNFVFTKSGKEWKFSFAYTEE